MVTMQIKQLMLASALTTAFAVCPADAKEIETNMARLQAMDKITGKVSVIEAPVNAETKFGSFSIVVRACKTRPPEETPDNFAFVDVVDEQLDGKNVNIFKGWMISSSPALNAIEHPIYDVWLLQCFDGKVEPGKLLSSEELRARDEIVMEERQVRPVSESKVEVLQNVPNDGEPQNLIMAESPAVSETAPDKAVAESELNTELTAPVGQPVTSAENATEMTSSVTEVSIPAADVPFDEKSGNVFEMEAVYMPEEGPQELVSFEEDSQTSAEPPAPSSEQAEPLAGQSGETGEQDKIEVKTVLQPEEPNSLPGNEADFSTEPQSEEKSAIYEGGFNTPEEFEPEAEREQTIEFEAEALPEIPQLNI